MSRKKEQEIGRKKGNSQLGPGGYGGGVVVGFVVFWGGGGGVFIYINRIFLSLAVNFSIYLLSCFFYFQLGPAVVAGKIGITVAAPVNTFWGWGIDDTVDSCCVDD